MDDQDLVLDTYQHLQMNNYHHHLFLMYIHMNHYDHVLDENKYFKYKILYKIFFS
jgi:hypothetical protein